MSAACCNGPGSAGPAGGRYRRVLWIALALNGAMFLVEAASGLFAGSVALQADALDFLGDAATYGLTLFVFAMPIRWRAGAALVKGTSMGLFGLWVIGSTVYALAAGGLPGAAVMGSVGALALVVNLLCAGLLYRFRDGDSNMRSVWLCSRNDAIGNLAVLAAAWGVFALGQAWPDLIVAAVMAGLALSSSWLVTRQALGELATPPAPAE